LFDVEMVAQIAHALGNCGFGDAYLARHHGLVFSEQDAANGLNSNRHALEVSGSYFGNPIEGLNKGG